MDLESEKAQLTPPQSAVRPSESHHCADLQNGLPGTACAADSSRSECLLGTFPNANLIRKRQEGESKRVHTDPQGGTAAPRRTREAPFLSCPQVCSGLGGTGDSWWGTQAPKPSAPVSRPPAPFDEKEEEEPRGWEEVGAASLPPLPWAVGGRHSLSPRAGGPLGSLSLCRGGPGVCRERVGEHKGTLAGNSQAGSQP